MALYEVTGPDGTVYEIEGPDGATEQQLIQAVKRQQRQEEIDRLRSQADALASAPPPAPTAPQTTFFGGLGEFAKGIPAGAIGLAETAAIGASALAPDEDEAAIRERISSVAETLRSPFEAAPGYEDSVARKFGEATGSIVPFLATAPFGLPGLAVAGGLGVGAGAGEARIRAEEGGATEEEKERATQLGAAVGLSEIVPVAKFARALRLTKPAGEATKAVDELNSIIGRGKRILTTAGYEGVQEFAANTAQNLIERGIYNPEQGVFTGSGEALGYGAGVGGLTQAITDIIIGRRARGMKGPSQAAPEEEGTSPEDLINAQTTDIVDTTPEATPEATPEDDMIRESAPGIDIAYPRAGQDIAALEAEAEAIRTGQPIPETVAPVAETVAPEAPVIPSKITEADVVDPEMRLLQGPEKTTPAADQADELPTAPESAQGLPEGVILQNRERSSPSSIQQMNSIANSPDYSKVGFSNSFLEGAPVVFGATQVPSLQLGRKGEISSGKTKRKIPVQYAVIEASQAIPSNNVDGTALEQYADPAFPGFKAVTNGRLAGLQEGYRRKTMEKYKQDLMADDIHGIDPAVISAMQNPLLVRIMPQNLVTKDIADESNTASTLALSATERAKNDANRIDLEGLQFREDGGISPDTVRGFIASMPQTEQQELIDKQGRPTKQAYDRLNAAIFSKAYQNDALIELAAQAEDAEAKNIINALSQAAPQMAVLTQGDYDVRPAILEATELAINARRQGQKLADLIAQQDLVSQDPVSRAIMKLYADNPRSAKKIGEGLRRIADAANAEASKSLEPDMFGDVPVRRPLADVVAEAIVDPQLAGDIFASVEEVRISPEQEKSEALSGFQRSLNQDVPPHKAKYGNGRTYTIRPKPLTEKQRSLLLDLAGSAIDLGMPASLLNKITAAGSTSTRDIAALATPRGWLTIGNQWAGTSKAEKLQTLIHEIAHATDYDVNNNPTLSSTDSWAEAVTELKKWYDSDPKEHPLRYPFAPGFANRVRLREETFAQAFSFYFTSPADLQGNAPNAYAQIDTIVKGIQNESGATQTRSAQARGIAEVDVQQARAESSAEIQPQAGAVSPSVSPTERGRDRAAGTETIIADTDVSENVVVDESGRPLTVYHGTTARAIDNFDTQRAGAWFSEDPYIAEAYTRRQGVEPGQIIPAQINIKNPLLVPEDIDMSKRYTAEEIINRINDDNATTFEPSDFGFTPDTEVVAFEIVASPRFINEMRRGGFDGIKAYEGGYTTWNVFDASQIKIAPQISDIGAPITQTPEFRAWSRNAPLVTRDNALEYDFQTGKPFVAESMHGTNAEDFDIFSMEMGGSQTGAESARMGIFSTSSPEVAGEYAKNVGMGRWLASAMVGSKESDVAKETLKKSGQLDRITKEQEKLRKEVADISAQITQRAEEIILSRAPEIFKGLSPDGKASLLRSTALAYRDTEKDIENLFQRRDEKLKAIDKLDQEYSGMMFDEMSRQLPQRIMPLYVRMNNPKVYDAKGKTPAEFALSDKISEARKQGHDGVVFKNIADPAPIAVHYVIFNPQDIKSATGNRGTFDPRDPSIIADVGAGEVRSKEELDAINEQIRDEQIREYQSLRQKMAAIRRRQVEDKVRDTDDIRLKVLYQRSQNLKAAIEMSQPVRDTPEDFMARMAKALADGDIERDVYDVADAMFKKNPSFLNGIRVSVRAGEGDAAGQFIPFARIIRLFKGSKGAYDPGTLRHEFAHSMEQIMPPEVKQKIVDKWRDALAKEIETNKTPQAQKYYDAVLKFIENPTRETQAAAIKELPSYHYYQFLNPSEYWAINAEPLMASYLGSPWQRFKTSMKGMLEAIKKVFGLNNQSEIYQAFKTIIDGERKGSTMLVDYIRSNAPIYNIQHRDYLGNPAPPPTWEMPPETMTPKLFGALNKTAAKYSLVDKLVDMRDALKAIESKVKQIDDNLNPSDKETNYHGIVAYEEKTFLKKELEPILKKMISSKITPQEYSAYALAKHAEERNNRIAEINPRFEDGGSGITTARAKAYLDRMPADQKAKLEELNSMIRKLIEKSQELEVKYGLTDRETIENGRKLYPNYVPLFRSELDYDQGGSGLGRGFDVRGPMSQRAVGSKRDIKDIFSSIIEQRQKIIIKGEKNKIVRSLYALSIANPNPEFWLPINPDAVKNPIAFAEELKSFGLTEAESANLMSEPKVPQVYRVKDPTTGQYREEVRYVNSPRAKISDNVVATRVNGKNRYVIFNPNNPRAARLASSLKNLDAEQLGALTQKVGTVTRWIASMSTQYNPIFGIWNFARDLQGAALNLSTTPLKGKQTEVLTKAIKFIPGMYKEYRAFRRGEEATGDTAELLRRFLKAGAQTGYRDQFTRLEEKGTIVENELKKLNPGNVRKVVNAVGGWLSDYNDVLENAVRLAAFKQAIDMDLSDQKAAVIAKNLTVNFNRKGANTPGLSALYAFFNAAVQGTARMAETLTGPAGRKIIAGGMLLGVVQAMVLRAFDFGEDEPTEFIKQKNLIIPTGDGGYLMWPMPLGFNFLPNIGRILTEMTFDGRTKARDRAVNLLEVMVDAFNPLGGAGFLQTISPTIIDPFVAVGENRDAFGRPISREAQATNPQAGYLLSRQNASEFSKLFAQALNYMSGGTEFTPGAISVTGDDIDYIVGQYLGGVGRETQKFAQLAKSAVTGEEVEQYRIPLLGKMYGETTSPAAVSSNFYRTIKRLAEHEQEIKGRAEKGISPIDYIEANPESRMYKTANRIENQISKINRTIRELRERNPDDPRIKLLEERKTETMQMFLDRLDELFPNQ